VKMMSGEIAARARVADLVGEHVQQDLRVGVRVDVPAVVHEELAAQLVRVDEVPVVAQHDAVRRVHVERLRFGLRRSGARRRIAAMGDAHVAHEVAHIARAEDVAHEAAALVHVEAVALGRDDARRVLAAVLQHRHPVVEELVDGAAGDDSDDSAHTLTPPSGRRASFPYGAEGRRVQ
jgi:hypothetical protein